MTGAAPVLLLAGEAVLAGFLDDDGTDERAVDVGGGHGVRGSRGSEQTGARIDVQWSRRLFEVRGVALRGALAVRKATTRAATLVVVAAAAAAVAPSSAAAAPTVAGAEEIAVPFCVGAQKVHVRLFDSSYYIR